MTSQAPDALQFLPDLTGEFEGVGAVSEGFQGSEFFRVSSLGVQEAVQGGLRGV